MTGTEDARSGKGVPPRTMEIVAALRALGSAYRGDWSEVDGRTIRDQLGELAVYLADPDVSFDLHQWLHVNGVCPESSCWHEHCREKGDEPSGPYSCAHYDAWSADFQAAREADASGSTPEGAENGR